MGCLQHPTGPNPDTGGTSVRAEARLLLIRHLHAKPGASPATTPSTVAAPSASTSPRPCARAGPTRRRWPSAPPRATPACRPRSSASRRCTPPEAAAARAAEMAAFQARFFPGRRTYGCGGLPDGHPQLPSWAPSRCRLIRMIGLGNWRRARILLSGAAEAADPGRGFRARRHGAGRRDRPPAAAAPGPGRPVRPARAPLAS